MKLIIAGSRHLDPDTIYDTLVNFFWPNNKDLYAKITEIVSGKAKGVDTVGELFAFNSNWPIKDMPADWNTYGKAAGHIRNKQMAEYADALLLVWDGVSKGSANMKQQMLKLNKPIYEVIINY